MFESLAGCELKRTPEQKIAKNSKKYLRPVHPSIHNEALLSLHLLTLFGPSSSFELSNDLLWKWFRGKECWNWLFRSLFPLNGFLPSRVWKSRVLFQWPPSQQVNWSSFLSSLLPLKVHRIIKSRFGSTYLLLSFQNTVSWGPWTAQLWAPVGSHKQQHCKILPLKVHQS